MQRFLRTLFLLTTCLLAGNLLFAQADYNLHLKSGLIPASELLSPASLSSSQFQHSMFKGKYHLLLQFDALPNIGEKEKMQKAGIRLLDYVPSYSFLAAVDKNVSSNKLQGFGVRAIWALSGHQKLAPSLAQANFPAHCVVDANHIAVSILPYQGINRADLAQHLLANGFETSNSIELRNALEAIIPISDLNKLAALAPVLFIQPIEPEPVPDGIRGRTSHRANTLSPRPGVGFDGTGVVLADADDGSVSHIDFHGRLTDFTNDEGGTHGDMTLGIAGGAGNLDPNVPGMATGADLILYDINGYPHVVNAISNFQTLGTVVTSTSFLEVCGGIYGGTAISLDADVYTEKRILHVFSAGNSASSTCSGVYGSLVSPDGNRYGNITGGRKAAKNSIATANLRYNDVREGSSSRGPCEDGRLKPDISAHGTNQRSTAPLNTFQDGGGTSAACPGIAGVSAMMYQAYKESHNGANPAGSFIKALLLNTADDMGRPGPDFDFGWGRVNAKRAYEAMKNNQFINSSVMHDSTKTHSIPVPTGVKQLKVMVLWLDAAGSPVASKALVNDLDMRLIDPAQNAYLPWRLSTVAHIDSILKPAQRGVDRLNNMEQVTLDDPAAGNYTVEVKGFAVPNNIQGYHIIYSYINDEIDVTYPMGGESLVPGDNAVIRWDAFGVTSPFGLEVSMNGGQSWASIGTVPANQYYFDWTVPNNGITPNARIRVTRGNQSGASADFNIMPQVKITSLKSTRLTTADLEWDPIPTATSYDIFVLGNKYMDSIATTTTTSFPFQGLVEDSSFWVAVRARRADGTVGQRSLAKFVQFKLSSICNGCYNTISSFPHYQSFENGFQDWCNFFNDDFDWSLNQGTTPSNNTGPAGANTGDFYIYTEVSGSNNPAKEAFLGSPCLSPPLGMQAFKMFFSYQMFGNDIGTLEIKLTTDNGGTWSAPLWTRTGAQGFNWTRDSIDLSAYIGDTIGIGLFTVSGQDFRGDICIDDINFAENERCTPLIVNSAVSNIECNGYGNGSISLSPQGGTPGYTYLWSNGNTNNFLNNLPGGNYSVIITDGDSCTTTASFTIIEPPVLNVDFVKTNETVAGAMDGTATADVTGGTTPYQSYQWSHGPNQQMITGLSAGMYVITVADANLCRIRDTVVIGVDPGVAIETMLPLNDVKLYPNPAQNEIVISLTSEERLEAVQLQVVDMLGRTLQTEAVQIQSGANRIKVDVSELSAGTYFVDLRAEGGRLTRTFVKVE